MLINHRFHKKILQAACFISCLFVFSCENDQRTIDAWTKTKKLVEEGKNIEAVMSQNGQLKAKLMAPYMLRYESDTLYIEFPKSLHVNFYDSTGKVQSHLDAKYGKYFENLNKVYLRDSVVVFNNEGDTLRSPDLWWDQSTQKIYTDKHVRVRKSGNLIFGSNGLTANQDLSEINIKQITGTVAVPDSVEAH